jgi:hypothetical protein
MHTKEEQLNHNFFRQIGLEFSRLISGSKSGYRKRFPDHEVYFNANIFTENGKIWHGDLDLNLDSEKLQNLANELQTDLYILSEMDGRFENGQRKFSEVKSVAQRVYSHINIA